MPDLTQTERRYLSHWVRTYRQPLSRQFTPPSNYLEFADLLECAARRMPSRRDSDKAEPRGHGSQQKK